MSNTINCYAAYRIMASKVSLTSIRLAKEVIKELNNGLVLTHSGPPLDMENEIPSVMRGGFIAGILFEGWAESVPQAESMLKSGHISFLSNQDFNIVAPGTGVISPSMSLAVFTNETYQRDAYVPTHEGAGKVMRFGGYSTHVLDRIRWVEKVFNPALKFVLEKEGPILINELMSLALKTGDELHSRNITSTLLFQQKLLTRISFSLSSYNKLDEILQFLLVNNNQFFLNYGMGAAKAMLMAADGVENSTIVTSMGISNRFGIKVAGQKRWFTGNLPELVKVGYLRGYTVQDAGAVIGDSIIMETLGLGITALAGAPGLWKMLSIKDFSEALTYKDSMDQICVGRWDQFILPQIEQGNMPLGIDCNLVASKGITPYLGVAFGHKRIGKGIITGVGIFKAPLEPYLQVIGKGGI